MAVVDNGRVEVVSVRFTKRIRELVKQVADARGLDESDVIRELVHRHLASLSYLTDEEKKALGVVVRVRANATQKNRPREPWTRGSS